MKRIQMRTKPRIISCLRHPYTTRQALATLLDFWHLDRETPIVLLTIPNQADAFTRNIRVALSKERQKYDSDAKIHYGFTQSTPFAYTEADHRGEAVVLRFRMTEKQKIRNQVADFRDIGGNFADLA